MHHIIYISTASHDLTQAELENLLEQARRYNAANNVTGVLLYGHRTVVQVLEGEQHIIEALYQRIAQDGRHTGVIKLADKPIEFRSFSEWSMGYEQLAPEQARSLQGYVDPGALDVSVLGLTGADQLLVQSVQAAILSRQRT